MTNEKALKILEDILLVEISTRTLEELIKADLLDAEEVEEDFAAGVSEWCDDDDESDDCYYSQDYFDLSYEDRVEEALTELKKVQIVNYVADTALHALETAKEKNLLKPMELKQTALKIIRKLKRTTKGYVSYMGELEKFAESI